MTILAALLLAFSGCVTHPLASARLLSEIAAPPDSPAQKQTQRALPEAIHFSIEGRAHRADLYLPREHAPAAGIVLVPGVARAGNRDTRLMTFAASLANARFAVLVPVIPNLRQLKVRADDAQTIRDGFAYLVSRPELAPEGRAGIAAASYALGPAVIAALDNKMRAPVQFIIGIGGYYDLEEVLTFSITGFYRDNLQGDGRWHYLKPSSYAKWVFLRSNLDFVSDARDRRLLRIIAERKLNDATAPVDAAASSLGDEGRTFFRLLNARRPEQVHTLLAQLPPGVRRQMDALNLARRDLARLNPELILIHGRKDESVPYTESKSLAAAAPRGRLFLVNNLAHVDISKGGWLDALRLLHAIDELLDHR